MSFNSMEIKVFETILGIDKVFNVYTLDGYTKGYEVGGYDGDTKDYTILNTTIIETCIRYLCSSGLKVSIDYTIDKIEIRILFLDKRYKFLNRKFTGLNKYDLMIETMHYYIGIRNAN